MCAFLCNTLTVLGQNSDWEISSLAHAGPTREQGVSLHVFLHFFALCIPGTRESLAAPNLEHGYLTRKTGRM